MNLRTFAFIFPLYEDIQEKVKNIIKQGKIQSKKGEEFGIKKYNILEGMLLEQLPKDIRAGFVLNPSIFKSSGHLMRTYTTQEPNLLEFEYVKQKYEIDEFEKNLYRTKKPNRLLIEVKNINLDVVNGIIFQDTDLKYVNEIHSLIEKSVIAGPIENNNTNFVSAGRLSGQLNYNKNLPAIKMKSSHQIINEYFNKQNEKYLQ